MGDQIKTVDSGIDPRNQTIRVGYQKWITHLSDSNNYYTAFDKWGGNGWEW